MNDTQQALLDKAQRALEAAEANLALEDAETVINRAYYAAFYAALAALEATGEHPKTHHGTCRRLPISRLTFVDSSGPSKPFSRNDADPPST